MSFFRKKKHPPSNSGPPNGLVSQYQASQRPQFPTESQSQSQSQSRSAQQTPKSQPLYPWSAYTPISGQSQSPFAREALALSTSATAAGELFLFGGYAHRSSSARNDLYMISTRDFSTTLLRTSGDIPNPRYGHQAVLTSTTLLIWGGKTNSTDQNVDDSFYLLNLVSREWARIVIDGPGPGSRYYHTMTLVGSKLFVFGGRTDKRRLNDMWALDLNYLKSNPFWESYDPAPGDEKPLPRAGHVSVTTGDRIIVFGGRGDPHEFNDTWSFNMSTRKWTELRCTGSIPSPRTEQAAVLVDGVMYVFGGHAPDETRLGDLTALNLSTQRWIAFQDTGPSPRGRFKHAMASDGRFIFVLGGVLSPGAQADEVELIHVLDTKLLICPELDSNTVKHSEKTTQIAQKLSTGHPTQGQVQHGIFSSSDGAFPSQIAISEDMGHLASPQITHERSPSLNGLPSQPVGVDDKPRWVPQEDDDSESSTEHLSKLVEPGASSKKEVARLEHGHIVDLERQLSETLAVQTERDRHLTQLTDQLAQKSALLKQAEVRVAKLEESLLSRDRALEQAQSALQKASCAAEANERSQRELTEMRAELETSKSESAAFRLRLADMEYSRSKSKAEEDTYRTPTATGPVNTDEDRVVHRLLERMQAMEAEIASLRLDEKSFERMECSNEG